MRILLFLIMYLLSFSLSFALSDGDARLEHLRTLLSSLEEREEVKHLQWRADDELSGVYVSIVLRYGVLEEYSDLPGYRFTLRELLTHSPALKALSRSLSSKGGELSIEVWDDLMLMRLSAPAAGADQIARVFPTLAHYLLSDLNSLYELKDVVRNEDRPESDPLDELIRRVLYGVHPYSLMLEPNPSAMSFRAFEEEVKRSWCYDRVYVAILGPESPLEVVVNSAERFLEALPSCPPLSTPARLSSGNWSEDVHYRLISGENSYIVFAYLTPPTLSRDYLAMMLLDEMLAGSFQSLILKELREQRGAIYSVNHYLKPLINGGYYVIMVPVLNSDTKAMYAQLNEMLSTDNLRDYVLRVSSSGKLATFKRRLYWRYLLRTAAPENLASYMALSAAVGYYWTPPSRLLRELQEVEVNALLKVIDENMSKPYKLILEGVGYKR